MGSEQVRTVADLVTRAAEHGPQRVALVDGPRTLTWEQLDAAVDRGAKALATAGLSTGDRVVIQIPNSLEFVELYLATLRAGLVAVPVNAQYTVAELEHTLSDSGARALATASVDAIAAAPRLRDDTDVDVVIAVFPHASNAATPPEGTTSIEELARDAHTDRHAAPVTVQAEDTAVLLYTSGTSGRPKGAMLSHRALLANIDQVHSIDPPLAGPDDVVLLPVPLAHIYGLNAGLGIALSHQATAVLVDKFDPARSLHTIREQGVTVVLGAPAMFAAWAAVPGVADHLAGVRFALSGSAPLPASLVSRYADFGVALHEGYGLTEAAPVVTLNAVSADGSNRVGKPKAGSIGAPLPGVEVLLIDAEGEPVEDGDPGAIAVRGANLFSGYWPDGRDGPGSDTGLAEAAGDGWWVSGDLGYADDDGDLVIVGRDNELVLVNGFNVYPAEVEAVLAAQDGVEDVAVLGIPDDTTGESLVAFIVPASGHDLDSADVLRAAARSLARFKLPRRVEIVSSLPHTVTGKVKKWQLRDRSSVIPARPIASDPQAKASAEPRS